MPILQNAVQLIGLINPLLDLPVQSMHVFLGNSDLVKSLVPVPSFMLVGLHPVFVVVYEIYEGFALRSHF